MACHQKPITGLHFYNSGWSDNLYVYIYIGVTTLANKPTVKIVIRQIFLRTGFKEVVKSISHKTSEVLTTCIMQKVS